MYTLNQESMVPLPKSTALNTSASWFWPHYFTCERLIHFVCPNDLISMLCVWDTDIHLRCERVSDLIIIIIITFRLSVKTLPVALGKSLHHLASGSIAERSFKEDICR